MKTTRTLAAIVAASAIFTGCAGTSQPMNSGYSLSAANGGGYINPAADTYVVIESIQVVQADKGLGAGAAIGGLVGALAGNQVGSGSGRTAATVAGGLAGAAIGNQVQDARSGQAYQINVRMDTGEYRTLVQQNLQDLRVGARVRVVDGQVYRY